jgi:predicted secreted protein
MAGTHGHGTTLWVDATTAFTSTVTYTNIGNITNIGGPDRAADQLDVTVMSSTGKYREFIKGLLDAGEISADANYDGSDSGTADLLNTLFNNTSNAYYFRITWPDTSYFQSSGNMSSLGVATPHDDKITQPLTIKLTGVPAYVDVAP